MRKSAGPRRRIKFTERLVYWLYLRLGALFLALPLTWRFRIGQAIGLVAWAILPGYRDLARRNLARAIPQWTPRQVGGVGRQHSQPLAANFSSAFVRCRRSC